MPVPDTRNPTDKPISRIGVYLWRLSLDTKGILKAFKVAINIKRKIHCNSCIAFIINTILNKVVMLLIQNIQYLHLTVQNNLMFTKILEGLVD